jgi:hypothetical protein
MVALDDSVFVLLKYVVQYLLQYTHASFTVKLFTYEFIEHSSRLLYQRHTLNTLPEKFLPQDG